MNTMDVYAEKIIGKLTKPMRDAILSWDEVLGVDGRVGTIVALIDRGLVTAGRVHHLTAMGKLVWLELDGDGAAVESAEETAPKPHLERTIYRIQSRPQGAEYWDDLRSVDGTDVDEARAEAVWLASRFPDREYRVVEIRELHTVVG